ncbi:MAG: hypothetical protein FJX68_01495 [Alphaproteobacteria bacterium]|nr:hypothetical protein [Alphaproteobacteria bacterium]
MHTDPAAAVVWAISEGHAGMENQCLGLAERLALPTAVLRLRPRAPWTWLPAGYWPWPLAALGPGSDRPAPPWPRLVLSCGRRAVPYALTIGRVSHRRTALVHIQNPQARLSAFDWVVAPEHDRLAGDNVIATLGALHRVNAVRLATAAARFAEGLAHLPRPLVTVLLGGSSRHHRLTAAAASRLAEQLAALARQGFGLAITPSRRTGEANLAILRERLAGSGAYLWDFRGDNPYFALLALADIILVTEDSVTMASEAAFTGKPLFVIGLEGGGRRLAAFHSGLRQAGHARPFAGRLEAFRPPRPLDEPGRVAALLASRLARRFVAA